MDGFNPSNRKEKAIFLKRVSCKNDERYLKLSCSQAKAPERKHVIFFKKGKR